MAAKSDPASAWSQATLLQQRAQHHGLIASVAGEHPAFTQSARLAARWVAAHFALDCHVAAELVELIAAASFTGSTSTAGVPGTLSCDACTVIG